MSDKPKVKSRRKVETIQEYLARGGSITIVPAAILEPQPEVTRKTTQSGPALFLSLDEADLFYGEPSKKKPKKSKPSAKIDLDALPPALRAKCIAKLKEENNGEGYEEEFKEESDKDDEA